MSDSVQPHRWQPTRLLRPWDFPGKSTGVRCHCLLQLHSIGQQIWKSQQWPQDFKRSVFIPVPKKCSARVCSNYHTVALISHASKVILKILQARLQQYVNQELPYVQAEFRKGRGTRDQIATTLWIIQKSRKLNKQTKKATAASLTMLKPLTVETNCGKFLKS